MSFELNFDGIVGPTHNYSGLSFGNVASMEHGQLISNPKQAALQGLAKMHTLMQLGIKQGVLPPQERPFIPFLHSLGFIGTEKDILKRAWKCDPKFVMAASSAACMWVANAATVSPSADSDDVKVHFTPANLLSKVHRSFEAATTGFLLYRIFNDPSYFVHHHPLPYHEDFADEGAANHTRLCKTFDQPGIQLFVYGKKVGEHFQPKKFPARQTEEASKALSRLHRLSPSKIVFAQQNPLAIDAGVFHNDVISVGHQQVFLYHEEAFVNTDEVVENISRKMEESCKTSLIAIKVKSNEISLEEAVKSYVFNSQIVTLSDQTMCLIAPKECQNFPRVFSFLEELVQNQQQPIRKVIYQELRESMQNGGGPACLRLRVALKKKEFEAIHKPIILTDELYQHLVKWIEKHYRDHLAPQDLADPQLLDQGRQALDELTRILQLGSIYSFQRMPML